jgi:hypothetical protein
VTTLYPIGTIPVNLQARPEILPEEIAAQVNEARPLPLPTGLQGYWDSLWSLAQEQGFAYAKAIKLASKLWRCSLQKVYRILRKLVAFGRLVPWEVRGSHDRWFIPIGLQPLERPSRPRKAAPVEQPAEPAATPEEALTRAGLPADVADQLVDEGATLEIVQEALSEFERWSRGKRIFSRRRALEKAVRERWHRPAVEPGEHARALPPPVKVSLPREPAPNLASDAEDRACKNAPGLARLRARLKENSCPKT